MIGCSGDGGTRADPVRYANNIDGTLTLRSGNTFAGQLAPRFGRFANVAARGCQSSRAQGKIAKAKGVGKVAGELGRAAARSYTAEEYTDVHADQHPCGRLGDGLKRQE